MFNISKRVYIYIYKRENNISICDSRFQEERIFIKSGKFFENISTSIISEIRDILRIKETFSN